MKQVDETTNSSSSCANATSETLNKTSSSANMRRVSSFDRLIDACKRKNLATIKSIVSERPELMNRRDKFSRNLLHYTVILTSANAKAGERHEPRTERRRASASALEPEDYQCLECFNYLADRCDLKLWWQQDQDGLSLLHLAVISSNVPLVKHIVYEHPYAIKYPLVCTLDNEHHSPLHWAVITNNLDCVKLLVNYAGVKLAHEPDLNGATPLHYATQTSDYPKYRRQLRRMLDGTGTCETSLSTVDEAEGQEESGARLADSLDEGSFDEQPRRLQQQQQHDEQTSALDTLEYLVRLPQINLESADRDRRTPLLWAASSGSREAIVLLVTHGANVNSFDINRLGALHCAASHGFTDCLECLLNLTGAGSALRRTGERAGEQVNQADNLSCTPLFYAVLSGNIDCIEILLDRGAKMDWQDAKGRTASHFAALKGQLHSLRLLHERGANLWLPNKQGDLPLHYAIKSSRQQVVQWLLEHSPYERAVNAINNFGRAPIHLAIQKDNAKMAEYLIANGANLNQLVKLKARRRKADEANSEAAGGGGGRAAAESSNGGVYHYETAMDMATRLGHHECTKLLVANQALTAARVIAERASGGQRQQPAKGALSVFDLHSAEGTSPIGFETSSSSATTDGAAMAQSPIGPQQRVPKLSRPAPDTIPASDSASSSSLSHNSPTFARGPVRRQQQLSNGLQQQQQQQRARSTADRKLARQDYRQRQSSSRERQVPYKGGISYNNELMDASIKCKVYNKRPEGNFASQSFPQDGRSGRVGAQQAASCSLRDLRASGVGQEIITNVNVYASPCANCFKGARTDASCALCSSPSQPLPARPGALATTDSEGATSDATTGESEQEVEREVSHQLPDNPAAYQARGQRLPPSQGYEQHLPVILSEREPSTSATSNEHSVNSPSTPPRDGGAEASQLPGHHRQQSDEEPRFDRSTAARSIHRRTDRYRDHVTSPVAQYIHGETQTSHSQLAHHEGSHARATSLSSRIPKASTDYSQVRARVDTHWGAHMEPAGSYEPGADSVRSKSMTNMQVQTDEGQFAQRPEQGHQSRSVSRQTVIRTRRLSVDSVELASSVEKAIRKYRQETRLFEELQSLKRSQIRSGRANEALLVKRLVEHFCNEVAPLDLLEPYHGPYTYKSYERFLYDQLRKLSQSNRAKLAKVNPDQWRESQGDGAGFSAARNFSDEDLKAELELRRVLDQTAPMGGEQVDDSDNNSVVASLILEPSGALEEIRVRAKGEPEEKVVEREIVHAEEEQGELVKNDSETLEASTMDEMVTVRRSSFSSMSSSRRSSIDVEREKLLELPLRVKENEQRSVEQQADSMTNSIIFDALGNVSRASSAKIRRDSTRADEEELSSEPLVSESDNNDTIPMQSPLGRRRSVVNIGNKMEVIYHDVAIEIDKAADERDSSEPESPTAAEPEQQAQDSPQVGAKEGERLENVEEAEEAEEAQAQADEIVPEATPETDESGRVDEEATSDLGSSQGMNSAIQSAKELSRRRASSPPAYSRDRQQARRDSKTTAGDLERSPAKSRRASVDSRGGELQRSSVIVERRKIFDGYDLDKMRGRVRPRSDEQIAVESANEPQAATEISEMETQAKDGEQQEDVSSRSSSMDDRATDEGFVSRSTVHRSISQRDTPVGVATTTRRRRLERSRIPSKELVIVAPIEQVKQRWAPIKARGRRALRCASDEPTSVFTFMDGGEQRLQQFESSLGSDIQANNKSNLAKSQPNLDKGDELQSDTGRVFPNFTLLYELNKSPRLEKGSGKGGRVATANWCHRRAIRIVDMRTLKRTMSLPESLIYSNNLLKRFNILKL